MGRLSGADLVNFEEHFLVCPSCQDRLAAADAFRQGVRSEGTRLQQQPVPIARPRRGVFVALGLAAALLIVAGIAWQPVRRPPGPPAVVFLQSTRGADDASASTTAAGQPIALTLDLTGLPALPSYDVEIVDAAGRAVVQSAAVRSENSLHANLSAGLPAGAYFVRVYTPSRELLREYALTVHR